MMLADPSEPGTLMSLATDYHLEHYLGGGPMTVVFAARELATDRPVALKFLRPDWEDRDIARTLLRREARAGLTVRHPHLVPYLAASLDEPEPFLTMALLRGDSVRDRLRRDYRLEIADAIWIIRQTAQALEALHHAGYLHGDLKAENLCLTGDGSVVLLDLGFAHAPGENDDYFAAGYLLGTPNYLAPELCGPEPDDTLAADLFALGVLLFELLTGEYPFPNGTLRQVLARHRSDPPADIRTRRRLPPRLARLVERLLSRNPADRPTAKSVVAALVSMEIESLGRRAA
jgi:serine/threonine protein kinase